MNRTSALLASILLLATSSPSWSQDQIADVFQDPALDMTNPEGRAKVVAKIKAIEDARAAKTRAKAKALGLKMRVEKPDGGVMEIVDFEGDKPVYLTTRNLNAAISTAANLVQASPYSLDGTGIIAGVWDSGSVRSTHQEFANGSRVTIMDGALAQDHSTHCGGTIGAQGTSANAKGMATNVSIASYDWTSDTSEMTSRAATGPNQFDTKIYVSNHSYGYSDGWNGNAWGGDGTDQNAADYSFGQYDSVARGVDSLMYSAPYYIAFWAAGNDGTDNPSPGASVTLVTGGTPVPYNPAIHPPGDGVYRNGFETIGSHGIAKNLITIGAANDAVTSGTRDPAKSTIASFSSTGPTDDGRIKPDLVANGVGLTSSSSSGDAVYNSKSGTSMATPNAVGSTALVIDQYKRLFNSAMRASTLKGLLIHTATDIGNPGPDYKYGWGLVDTKKAVDLIRDHQAYPAKTRIIEDQVTTSTTTRTHSFLWDGASPLRATACWTDPAGASTTEHDLRTARLVNNLNLKLIAPNGTEYFPYMMPFVGTWTVASMSQNATTGVNNTDNVETVLIQSPGLNGTWQAVVSYTGALTNNAQAYGLILSGTADTPNIVNVTSPNGGETFYRESPYTITWASNVSGNVSIELLKGGVLHSVLSANEANDGSFTWAVPSSLTLAADYAIRISSVSNSSYTDNSEATFTIAVNPWANALDTAGIPWNSPGAQPWFSQSTTTNDGVDALQSGAIDHNGSSVLEATITGPGTLTFRWKVSSEIGYDFLRFYRNGVEQTGSLAKISGNVNWVQKTVTIPSGSQTIQWTYSKDGSVVSGSDAAWVDQVVFTAVEFAVVTNPSSLSLAEGGSNTFQVKLSAEPAASVTVTVSRANGDSDITVQSGGSLTFTTTNWNAYQVVTLAAAEDNADNAAGSATISCSGAGITSAIVIASEIDDDHVLSVSASNGLITKNPDTAYYDRDSMVQLTAVPNTGYHFTGWSGAASGSENPLTVVMSADKSISANFAADTLTLTIDAVSIYEAAGSTTATVTRNSDTTGTLTVSLSSNDPTEASVPATVEIPEGQASAIFSIAAIDDEIIDGTQTVTITATATDHASGANTIDITDNDHLTYSVTYNGNGNTSGAIPDAQTKTDGVNLMLLTNTRNLGRTNFIFSGWNTLAEGTGTDYAAGGSYSANAAVTLYAKWTPKTTPTVNTWPTAAMIQEGQALSSATLSGGSASVAGSFGYNTPSVTPSAGIYSAAVTFTPADTTLYNLVEGTVNVTVLAPFEAWANESATFNGDSNNDRVLDGLAWLLGAVNPDQNASVLLPSVGEGSSDMVVGFQCLNASKRGSAMLRLQYSTDLGGSDPWTNHIIPIPDTSSTVDGVVFVITPIEGSDLVQVQATVPATGDQVFVRLNARLTPP